MSNPCGAAREVLEDVTWEEVINMVNIVKELTKEAKQLTVSITFIIAYSHLTKIIIWLWCLINSQDF